MSDFTFLTEEQCFGDEQLDILKKRGTKSAITDFSVLLGGYIDDDYHIDSDSSLDTYSKKGHFRRCILSVLSPLPRSVSDSSHVLYRYTK